MADTTDTADMILAEEWWTLALRGVLAIIVGLIALFFPGVTLAAFVLLFGAYMLVDGIFALIAGFRAARRHERSWPLFLEGVATSWPASSPSSGRGSRFWCWFFWSASGRSSPAS
jgi:uncharacterized membrane protein HdeD (DUF308 family)